MDQLAASGFQQGLLQPEFFPTKQVGDVSNFDPSDIIAKPVIETEADSEEKAKEKKLRRKQRQSQFKVDRLAEQLADLGGPAEEAPKDDKDDRRGSNRGSGGGGSGGGMSRPGSGLGGAAGGMQGGRRSGQSEENMQQRVELTKRLRALEKELEEINKDLEALVGKDAAKPASATNTTDLLTAESVIVWTHDLAANPGDTYRYRSVAKVYNPFFTSGPLLVESQKKLADDFSLVTQTAGWSDPVRVSTPVEFFVTQAVAGEGKLGLGTATVEVYRFHDGDRRLETFSIQPGDRIGVKQDGIDYDTGYFLVDVYVDPSTERSSSDRRPAAIAVVQNLAGDRYEIRVPRFELENTTREKYQDFAKLRALESAGKGDGKAGGKDGADKPPA